MSGMFEAAHNLRPGAWTRRTGTWKSMWPHKHARGRLHTHFHSCTSNKSQGMALWILNPGFSLFITDCRMTAACFMPHRRKLLKYTKPVSSPLHRCTDCRLHSLIMDTQPVLTWPEKSVAIFFFKFLNLFIIILTILFFTLLYFHTANFTLGANKTKHFKICLFTFSVWTRMAPLANSNPSGSPLVNPVLPSSGLIRDSSIFSDWRGT